MKLFIVFTAIMIGVSWFIAKTFSKLGQVRQWEKEQENPWNHLEVLRRSAMGANYQWN